jgi:hypothetical protein
VEREGKKIRRKRREENKTLRKEFIKAARKKNKIEMKIRPFEDISYLKTYLC